MCASILAQLSTVPALSDLAGGRINDEAFRVAHFLPAIPCWIDRKHKQQVAGVFHPAEGLDVIATRTTPVTSLEIRPHSLSCGPLNDTVPVHVKDANLKSPVSPSAAPGDRKALIVVRPFHTGARREIAQSCLQEHFATSAEHECSASILDRIWFDCVSEIPSFKAPRRVEGYP